MKVIAILTVLSALLLSGCAAKYGIPGHRAHQSAAQARQTEYPTLILEEGTRIRAVTPAKGMLVGGYWLGVYVENSEVARHLPRNDSYFEGTDIEAVSPGRTKAYYVNAVNLMNENGQMNFQGTEDWFWIEVVETAE